MFVAPTGYKLNKIKGSQSLQPAPNARSYVTMMAEGDRRRRRVLPDWVGMSPLNERFPDMLKDWQDDLVKDSEDFAKDLEERFEKASGGNYREYGFKADSSGFEGKKKYYRDGEEVSRSDYFKGQRQNRYMKTADNLRTLADMFENAGVGKG